LALDQSVAVVETRWELRAACRDAAELFNAAPGETTDERGRRERAAKLVCAHCDVLTECRAYALRVREPLGIWGGLTATERRSQTVH
jgi:WhiB family redox-sensing transcriptional regulator